MNITLSDVNRVVHFGDVVCVTYRKADGVAKLLRFFEGGRSSHSIECLGGLDIVEETIGGGMRTNLYTYLRGQCDLEVRRVSEPLNQTEAARIRSYWLSLVGKGYGWDSIKRSMITVPIRRFVKPHYPRLAQTLVAAAEELLPGRMVDCSAAWVAGIRLVRPRVFLGVDPTEVDPDMIQRTPHLTTVARWNAPVLVE